MLQFFNIYWRVIITFISLIGISITIVKIISNSLAIRKISQNEIKHLQKDVNIIKEEEKEFKREIKDELHQINLACNRMERKIEKREIICNERHKKDKK